MRASLHLALWAVGLVKAETQTSHDERRCLATHVANRHRPVEIGVWHGVTSALLRRSMDPMGTLLLVDPFPAGRLGFSMQRIIARREVARVRQGTICWLRTTGAEAARRYRALDGPAVDFVFVDGDHSYDGVRADWEGWSGLVAPGGVVALHDSRPVAGSGNENAGSVRFTRDVISVDPRFELADAVDSISVFRRREITARGQR